MSSKEKRKPKAKAAPKRRERPVKKRAVPKAKKEKEKEKEIAAPLPEKTFTLVIRIDGLVASPTYIENTLRSLRLDRRFSAVLLEKNPSLLGMLMNAKDYVTWGEVNNEALALLLKERAKVSGGLRLTDAFLKERFGEKSVDGLVSSLTRGRMRLNELWQKGVNPVFRLRPPSGGFHYSTKRPFATRGELGYRGAHISDLLTQMV